MLRFPSTSPNSHQSSLPSCPPAPPCRNTPGVCKTLSDLALLRETSHPPHPGLPPGEQAPGLSELPSCPRLTRRPLPSMNSHLMALQGRGQFRLCSRAPVSFTHLSPYFPPQHSQLYCGQAISLSAGRQVLTQLGQFTGFPRGTLTLPAMLGGLTPDSGIQQTWGAEVRSMWTAPY